MKTLRHFILLSKLKAYGVGSNSSNWFKSYWGNRTQKCFVNGSLSDSQPLTCGIPQGTILGPLFLSRGGGGLLPYVTLTGTCGPIGYGFQGVLS